MPESVTEAECDSDLPNWLPEAARNYISHTEEGRTIRYLAQEAGCQASTVLRQGRKIEARRDDSLIEKALSDLGAKHRSTGSPDSLNAKDSLPMNAMTRPAAAPDQDTIERDAKRILRRLREPAACLAVAQDKEKAVVVRETVDGKTTHTGVVDRPIAQAMALKDWIACDNPGRISRYAITTAGRAALKRLLSENDAARRGFSEAAAPFADQYRIMEERDTPVPNSERSRRIPYNLAESPILAMSRRKDKDGNPFVSSDRVSAVERLREVFELAQIDPRITQNWKKFLTGGDRGAHRPDSGIGNGPSGARERVSAVLRDLGPGLGDVVLRIALQRLKRHYEELGSANLIG